MLIDYIRALGGLLFIIGIAYLFSANRKAVAWRLVIIGVSIQIVFGLLIALIGCHYGLRVKPNTQSLSEGTTASVVTSITMVIVVDALSAVVFKSIGIV